MIGARVEMSYARGSAFSTAVLGELASPRSLSFEGLAGQLHVVRHRYFILASSLSGAIGRRYGMGCAILRIVTVEGEHSSPDGVGHVIPFRSRSRGQSGRVLWRRAASAATRASDKVLVSHRLSLDPPCEFM